MGWVLWSPRLQMRKLSHRAVTQGLLGDQGSDWSDVWTPAPFPDLLTRQHFEGGPRLRIFTAPVLARTLAPEDSSWAEAS